MPTITDEPLRSIASPGGYYRGLRRGGHSAVQAAERLAQAYPDCNQQWVEERAAEGERKFQELQAALSAPEPAPEPAPEIDPIAADARLDELRTRRAQLAPEAVANPDGLEAKELSGIEAEIADIKKRRDDDVRHKAEAEATERGRVEKLTREAAALTPKIAAAAPAVDKALAVAARAIRAHSDLVAAQRQLEFEADGRPRWGVIPYSNALRHALEDAGVPNVIQLEGGRPHPLAPAEDRSVTDSPKSRRRTPVKGAEHDA